MSANAAVTRKDIDDVLGVIDVIMTRIDKLFSKVEITLVETQKLVKNVLNQLDSIETN